MIVIAIYFFIITLIFLISKYSKKDLTLLYIVVSSYVFGQRWGSGTDFPGYYNYYLTNFKREYLYTYLQEFIIKKDLNFGIIIFITYLITIILFVNFFKKITKNYNEITYLFLLSEIHFAMQSQIRNWLAIGFFINGYYYLKIENRKKLSFLLILLGLGFHKSIIFILAILLVKISFQNFLKIRKMLLAIILILVFVDIKIILKLFPNFHYYGYIMSKFGESLSIVSKLKFISLYFIYILYITYEKKDIEKTREDKFIEMGAYIYLILSSISLNMGMFIRISYYFKVFELLYIFNILQYTKLRKLKIIPTTYFVLYLLGCLFTGSFGYKKYQFKPLKLYKDIKLGEYEKGTTWEQ